MIQWFIDKENKMPLYLQLRDLIKYYISTGAIQADHQLPAVNALAKDLGINFETIRKAYKELEKDGLVSMKRGQGTFITLHNAPAARAKSLNGGNSLWSLNTPDDQLGAAKSLIRQYLRQGLDLPGAERIIARAVSEVAKEETKPLVIFTECNQLQIGQISRLLSEQLKLQVRPMLVAELKAELPALLAEASKEITLITTGFHIDEVRRAVGELPVSIDVLITNLAPETRRQLEALGQQAKYAFICRDQESAILYHDLLRAELDNDQLNLTCCTLAETARVKALLKSVDVALASPPVYEEVRKLAPRRLPVFNVFERVDPMSLKIIRDRLLGTAERALE